MGVVVVVIKNRRIIKSVLPQNAQTVNTHTPV